MELSLSGNALKTLLRSVTCLARIGNDVVLQASPSQIAFHTLNSSRSAFQTVTFKSGFFDVYAITGHEVECRMLLKGICSVLRTPIASVDHLSIKLPEPGAPKVQWTLECYNGVRKSYWITCNVEPNVQQLSVDKTRFPSNFVVRPRDLNRLLSNFQSSLQEITIIATEPNSLPSDVANEIGGKAVELRSYIDPTKENDSSLHTQLWIDPMEEFLHYTHTGDPVDVTFGVKELKAFLSLCEGCEVDFHLYFERAGEPILMAPKFGLDDGSNSNLDATLVLATMLVSQLHETHPPKPPRAAATKSAPAQSRQESQAQARSGVNISEHPSDHTRVWSDLSASARRNGNVVEGRPVQEERSLNACEQRESMRLSQMHISNAGPSTKNHPANPNICHVNKDHVEEPQDRADVNGRRPSEQHHPSNWVDANEDGDEDDGEDHDLYVQATPPYHEEF